MSGIKDLTGQRFGRLTVIARAENDENNRTQWICRCDCGNEVIVKSHYLIMGKRKVAVACKKKLILLFIQNMGIEILGFIEYGKV